MHSNEKSVLGFRSVLLTDCMTQLYSIHHRAHRHRGFTDTVSLIWFTHGQSSTNTIQFSHLICMRILACLPHILNFNIWKTNQRSLLVQFLYGLPFSWGLASMTQILVTNWVSYTLLQKKCTLIYPSSPSDPGSLTLTLGHVDFVKWSWQQYAKDPIQKFPTVLSQL